MISHDSVIFRVIKVTEIGSSRSVDKLALVAYVVRQWNLRWDGKRLTTALTIEYSKRGRVLILYSFAT